ncbi:MAG: tetratricopeptide repeat protein [Endomicrobiales bacterium]
MAARLPRRMLARKIEAALPGTTCEALNCGIPGSDSYRARQIGREVAGYAPDVVVVLVGNNEELRPHRPLPRGGSLLARTRLYGLAAGYLNRGEPAGRPEYNSRFRENISVLVRSLKERGAALVLCTLPVNFKDMPPQGEAPLDDPQYFQAERALEDQDYPRALAHLRRAQEAFPRNPHIYYSLGKVFEKERDFKKAQECYLTAVELDRGLRCPPSRNNIIRQIAAENGAALADLERAFMDRAPHGLVGWELLGDICHPYHSLNGFIPDEILAAAVESGGLPLPGPGPRPAGGQGEENVIARLVGEERASPWYAEGLAREAVQFILHRKGRFSAVGLVFMERLYEVDPSLLDALTPQAARDLLTQRTWTRYLAPELDRYWPGVLCHAGEAYRRKGKLSAAVALFNEAIERDPGLFEPFLFRALALQQAGEREKAGKDFERVQELRPSFAGFSAL